MSEFADEIRARVGLPTVAQATEATRGLWHALVYRASVAPRPTPRLVHTVRLQKTVELLVELTGLDERPTDDALLDAVDALPNPLEFETTHEAFPDVIATQYAANDESQAWDAAYAEHFDNHGHPVCSACGEPVRFTDHEWRCRRCSPLFSN